MYQQKYLDSGLVAPFQSLKLNKYQSRNGTGGFAHPQVKAGDRPCGGCCNRGVLSNFQSPLSEGPLYCAGNEVLWHLKAHSTTRLCNPCSLSRRCIFLLLCGQLHDAMADFCRRGCSTQVSKHALLLSQEIIKVVVALSRLGIKSRESTSTISTSGSICGITGMHLGSAYNNPILCFPAGAMGSALDAIAGHVVKKLKTRHVSALSRPGK